MKIYRIATLCIACLCLLSACASVNNKNHIRVSDTVGQIDDRLLVGKWKVRELNPGSDAQAPETIIEYHDNGSLTGFITISDTSSASGNLSFDVQGNWYTEGELLKHADMHIQSTSQSQLGQLMSNLMNQSGNNLGGMANVYDISANRIIMVGTRDDDSAMVYTRHQP